VKQITKKPPAHQLYSRYVNNIRARSTDAGVLAQSLWDNLPLTIGEAVKELEKKRHDYRENLDSLEDFKIVMKRNLRKMGVLTGSTVENIDSMHLGVIETGQQPNCLGGPSLVFNKISCISKLAELADMVPLFSVVDYDGTRPELTKTRYPSLSPRGLEISYLIKPNEVNCPIYRIDNPSEKWFKQTIERIKNNYKGLVKRTRNKERILQNLNHIFTIIRSAFYSTNNVSQFSTKIISTILNLDSDLGIPVQLYSMQDTKPIFQEGYESLLSEPNRSKFIKTINATAEKINTSEFSPQIGLRNNNYVPFYLECSECNHNRIELNYVIESNSIGNVKGKCNKCSSVFKHSFQTRNPDLTDIIDYLSPRVDSRQFIINSVVPVVSRIGGPAETSYFAQLIPVAKALKISFPVFMRYTRVFYNTPWNESKANKLAEAGHTSLTNKRLFRAIGKWTKTRNKKENLASCHKEIYYSINLSYRRLVQEKSQLEKEIESFNKQLRETSNRNMLLANKREKQKTLQEIMLYLSWVYGRYNPDKYGQEVNWNWLDLAINTGLEDFMGIYERLYNAQTPNGSMFFINLQ
jgi:uncharacterized protein YllA (UPF0747 family)